MKLRTLSQRAARRAAFTLMEMMVVVAIIVALAGAGIFYMAGQVDQGYIAKAKADIKSIETAAFSFKTKNAEHRWPQSIEELTQRDADGNPPPIPNPEDVISPWGKQYVLDPSCQRNNGSKPDIYCESPLGVVCNWSRKLEQR